tara:strand:+ start:279 stop:2156 length:1878 start_codon:yes stop_codon:yes gene_type:complete
MTAQKKATKKKAAGKSEASEGLSRSEVKQAVSKIKKFLKQRDYDAIDTGIELARSLGDPGVFEALLEGCSIADDGRLIGNRALSGYGEGLGGIRRPYGKHAMFALLGCAPSSANIDPTLVLSNIKALDLSDLDALQDVAVLANCTKLATLDLTGCGSLMNVDGLAGCSKLTKLNLGRCDSLENVDGLANCTKLTDLSLRPNQSLENVAGLANCAGLTTLDLGFCESLKDLDGLSGCTKITRLALDRCPLENMDALANCVKLTSLNLTSTFFKNVDALANCTQLAELDLYHSSLENVDGLANCKKLTKLNLTGCSSLLNVDGIVNCKMLTTLEMGDCSSLENVDGLANSTKLAELDLNSCTSLNNVNGLANWTKLTRLNLNNCKSLENVDGLANCTNLKNLSMVLCCFSLENIDGLANCVNLTELNLSNCGALKNVDGLTGCTKLKSLVMDECTNVRPRPSPNRMSTRKEVAAYQARIETGGAAKSDGQELLDALSEVIGWTDEWEDIFPWFDMANNTHYDETEPTSPMKTSWCQIEEYKDIWAVEVVTGGKSRGGEGWFGDDLEINSFELNWKWCDGDGEWRGAWEEDVSTEHRDKAHRKFREWVEQNSTISEALADCGSSLSEF